METVKFSAEWRDGALIFLAHAFKQKYEDITTIDDLIRRLVETAAHEMDKAEMSTQMAKSASDAVKKLQEYPPLALIDWSQY